MIATTVTALSLLSSLSLTLSLVEDPVRASLQTTADHFSNLVSWSTVAVAVGVALEGVEIAHAVVAWRKRKKREKREGIELQELAAIFPGGDARCKTKLHSDDPGWVKLLLRLGIIIVVIGIIGEWRFGAKLEDAHNAIHEYDVAKLTAAEQAAGDAATSAQVAHEEADAVKGIADEARADAKDALGKAQAAQGELAHAEADAAKAQIAASNALRTAGEAGQVAHDTKKEVAEAAEELKRVKTQRSILHPDKVIVALQQFSDAEYVFSGVGADEDSLALIKQIDDILKKAGWKRQPAHGRYPAINIFESNNADQSVTVALISGVLVSVDSEDALAALQSKPLATLPRYLRAAISLELNIVAELYPPEEKNKAVDVVMGNSTVIRITIGHKP